MAALLVSTDALLAFGQHTKRVIPTRLGTTYEQWVDDTLRLSRAAAAALDAAARGLRDPRTKAAAESVQTICNYMQRGFEATVNYRVPWSPQNHQGFNSTPELLLDADFVAYMRSTHWAVVAELLLVHLFRFEFLMVLVNSEDKFACQEQRVVDDELTGQIKGKMQELRLYLGNEARRAAQPGGANYDNTILSELGSNDVDDIQAGPNWVIGNAPNGDSPEIYIEKATQRKSAMAPLRIRNEVHKLTMKILDLYTDHADHATRLTATQNVSKQSLCQYLLQYLIKTEEKMYGFIPKWSTEDPHYLVQKHMAKAWEFNTVFYENANAAQGQVALRRQGNRVVDVGPVYQVKLWQRKLGEGLNIDNPDLSPTMLRLAMCNHCQFGLMADLVNALAPLSMANESFRLGDDMHGQNTYALVLSLVNRDVLLQSTENGTWFETANDGEITQQLRTWYDALKVLDDPQATSTGTTQPFSPKLKRWLERLQLLSPNDLDSQMPLVMNALTHRTLEQNPKTSLNTTAINGCLYNIMWQNNPNITEWAYGVKHRNGTDIQLAVINHIIAMNRFNSMWLCHMGVATEKLVCMLEQNGIPNPLLGGGANDRSLDAGINGGNWAGTARTYNHIYENMSHWRITTVAGAYPNDAANIDRANTTVPFQPMNRVLTRIKNLNKTFNDDFAKRLAPFMPPHWWLLNDNQDSLDKMVRFAGIAAARAMGINNDLPQALTAAKAAVAAIPQAKLSADAAAAAPGAAGNAAQTEFQRVLDAAEDAARIAIANGHTNRAAAEAGKMAARAPATTAAADAAAAAVRVDGRAARAPPADAPGNAARQAAAKARAETNARKQARFGGCNRWEEADVQDLTNNGIVFRFNNNLVAAPTPAAQALKAQLRSHWHPLPVQ